jgi:hypothetical protein
MYAQMKYKLIMYIALGLGLGRIKIEKKEACPARVAKAGQENIETVHEPEPIQTIGTLCNGQGRRAMEGPHGPQTQVHEGTCAIKVSMQFHFSELRL